MKEQLAVIAFLLLVLVWMGSCLDGAKECEQRKGCPPGQRPRYFVGRYSQICTCELEP